MADDEVVNNGGEETRRVVGVAVAVADEEVDSVGEETPPRKNEEEEGDGRKKLRRWRMPQRQIDLILSWAPFPLPRPRYREGLAASEEEKEALRRLDADGAEAMRSMNRYGEERQEWVKSELAAHGYVECEIDDDDNTCTCGGAYTSDDDEEGDSGGDDCICDHNHGDAEEEDLEMLKTTT